MEIPFKNILSKKYPKDIPGETESPFMAKDVMTGTLAVELVPGTILHVPAWHDDADGLDEDIVRDEVDVAGEGEHDDVDEIAIFAVFSKFLALPSIKRLNNNN